MGVNRVGKMEMGFTCVHIASLQVSHAGLYTHLHKLSSRSTQAATLHGGTGAEMPQFVYTSPELPGWGHIGTHTCGIMLAVIIQAHPQTRTHILVQSHRLM